MLDHLPDRDKDRIRAQLRSAWALDDHVAARERLEAIAADLERQFPGAAASLREGLDETLTVIGLGITGRLKLTLMSTNPIESMISTVRLTSRNVRRWQSGDMFLRWTAAGMLEAERRFRRVKGYKDLATLATAVKRHLASQPRRHHQAVTV